MTGPELLAARKITLLAGSSRVPPNEATEERILAAVAAHNQAARLEGQPDALNPSVLDPARVKAFVDGLARVPEAVLSALAGKFLVLGAEGMRLAESSPVTAEDIEGGYTLSLPEEDGAVLQPSLHTRVRKEHAEPLAARAEQAARAADAELEALEKQGGAAGAISNARFRRFASAKVWQLAARALAEAEPRDRAAKKRASEASSAVRKWVAPSWMGMRR